jgi:hypothetical protein
MMVDMTGYACPMDVMTSIPSRKLIYAGTNTSVELESTTDSLASCVTKTWLSTASERPSDLIP